MTTSLMADRRPATDAFLATASAEVLVLSTGTLPSASPFGLPSPAHYRNLRRGVRYRVLVPDLVRTTAPFAPQVTKLAMAGADIRTVPEICADTFVVDHATAVYPAECGAAPFRLPGVVATAIGHFEQLWASAIPFLPSEGAELDGREREVLSLLANGLTDAAAAAELGVSVRTIRRLVAGLMDRLGARSRFMAGVKAAHHGWLSAADRRVDQLARKIA